LSTMFTSSDAGSAVNNAPLKPVKPKATRQCQRQMNRFVDTFVDFAMTGDIFDSSPASAPTRAPTVIPAAERLVAIGDLHGDLEKTRETFRLSGLIDDKDHWTGGKTVVVQVGDQLDRGPKEIHILLLLERWKQEAVKTGGQLISMNGNHETMSCKGDFRYAQEGFEEFQIWKFWYELGQKWKRRCGIDLKPLPEVSDQVPLRAVARWQGLQCGGPITKRFLAPQSTVQIVGKSLFAHGGLLQEHLDYGLEKLNDEVNAWMLAPHKTVKMPRHVRGRDSVVWSRHFGSENQDECQCDLIDSLFRQMAVNRMIIGHTIQGSGINTACADRVFRIDVGMSKGCIDGQPQSLEIVGDRKIEVLPKPEGGAAGGIPWPFSLLK